MKEFSGFRFQVSGSDDSVRGTQYSVPASTGHRPSSIIHRGLSLVEVLAAIGVLSVGLLGLAALLPLGRLAIAEATRNDRIADCGRAALHDVRARRMLDPSMLVGGYPLNSNFPLSSYLIDPLGVSNGLTSTFGAGATATPRKNLQFIVNNTDFPMTPTQASAIFIANDDLRVAMPEDQTATASSPALPANVRSSLVQSGGTGAVMSQGNYSWFLTVTPWPTDPVYSPSSPTATTYPYKYTVSVVVCDHRDWLNTNVPGAERAVKASFPGLGKGQVALGGGNVTLSRPLDDMPSDGTNITGIRVHENDWVALCSSSGLCQWYQVATISEDDPANPTTSYVTLNGPDWTIDGSEMLVTLGKTVAGVYTETIVLDQEPIWKD